jgi:hypothetical protein
MKRRNLTRGASILFALTLITTSIIGGTFAKYTTMSKLDKQTAKVAKWGVEVTTSQTVEGLFGKSYLGSDNKTTTVKASSSNDGNIVAPGTKSGDDHALNFSIKGKPETAVTVEIKLSGKDIVLPKNDENTKTYVNYTEYPYTKTFTLEDDYYPIKYTLKKGTTTIFPESGKTSGTLADVALALAQQLDSNTTSVTATNGVYTLTKTIYPTSTNDVDLDTLFGDYTLTWEWDYGDAKTDKGHDQADTYLGNLIAGTPTGIVKPTGASTDIEFGIEITVTQDGENHSTINEVDKSE